jgi:hypothetical protein
LEYAANDFEPGEEGAGKEMSRGRGVLLVMFLVLFGLGRAASALETSDENVIFSSFPIDWSNLPAEFSTVTAALQGVVLVEADFREEKKVSFLRRPLTSEGIMVFSSERGLYRRMVKPIPEEIIITRADVYQKGEGGAWKQAPLRKQPAAQAFVEVFLSFYGGDPAAWDKQFQVYFTGDRAGWRIGFKPKKENPMARMVKQIVLAGHGAVLESVHLAATNGDDVQTSYFHPRLRTTATAEDLRPYFDLAAPPPSAEGF